MPNQRRGRHYQQSLKVPKFIVITGKLLQFISPRLAMRFAVRLFGAPLKHSIPKRELKMDAQSTQEVHIVPSIHKEIVVYQYGSGKKRVLLVHGWSGRGTQLARIAEALVSRGYQTISFDAPAHGKAKGTITHMNEFIESILYVQHLFGNFQVAIGHSLGGMSLLNAINQGFTTNKLITIGSGDIVSDIVDDFVKVLQLKPKISQLLQEYYKKKVGKEMNDFSASTAAKKVSIPVLVIHDKQDPDVPVSAAQNILKNLKKGTPFLTEGLGHKKILGNGTVIDTICTYIETP